jgi:hypothetical protein
MMISRIGTLFTVTVLSVKSELCFLFAALPMPSENRTQCFMMKIG